MQTQQRRYIVYVQPNQNRPLHIWKQASGGVDWWPVAEEQGPGHQSTLSASHNAGTAGSKIIYTNNSIKFS
jgi:hypothetical protein